MLNPPRVRTADMSPQLPHINLLIMAIVPVFQVVLDRFSFLTKPKTEPPASNADSQLDFTGDAQVSTCQNSFASYGNQLRGSLQLPNILHFCSTMVLLTMCCYYTTSQYPQDILSRFTGGAYKHEGKLIVLMVILLS